MSYELSLDGSEPGRLTLLDDDHALLADTIMRGAGAVRLLRRLVDGARRARFTSEEVKRVLHELADLRAGLGEEELSGVDGSLESLRVFFERARERGAGVRAGGDA